MFPWKLICELLIFIIVATFTIVVGVDNDKFSVCGPTTTPDDSSASFIFVTTLDGKVTALDLANNGEKKWTIDFNDEPLISSSIHHRELNNDGYWVRLIPSLSGGLYKFNGEKVERVPVTTDQLLKSSYRYSDDLVFSGGKETRSYGVSSRTGRVVYQCNINGCSNTTEDNSYFEPEDILIIKRYQQTVRAIEPRTGQEKWNYSVGQHELVLIPKENRRCNNNKLDEVNNDVELKAAVPDGVIWALNKNNPTAKLWKHQFDSPIVSIWRENVFIDDEKGDNKLEEINLFDSSQYSWGVEFSIRPSLYIGMHSSQLYVQENINYAGLHELSSGVSAVYPWQPYPAVEKAIAFRGDDEKITDENNDYEGPFLPYYQPQATALSVLYNSKYINGFGYYLYTEDQAKDLHKCNQTDPNIQVTDDEPMVNDTDNEIDDETNVETSIQIIITSLWYWWREVTIISITTAFLLNYFLTQRLLNATTPTNDAVAAPIIVERHVEMKAAEEDTVKISINEPTIEFKSRYLSDFMPINCLGKGGYGVVFEAKNRIDDCNYAIKRIALPNSKDSRDRVMREVKALAKLDHHNIVRYFHAWLECPPVGWQEKHDQLYINKQLLTPSQCPTTTATSTTTDNNTRNTMDKGDVVCIDVSLSNRSSVDSAIEAVELNYMNEEDSSFIIFDGSHSGESAMTEEYDDELSSSNNSENLNNNSLNNDNDDEAHSISIVFKNSTNCSSECDSSSKDCDKSLSVKMRDQKKSVNKKTPKMFLYIQMQLCQRSSLREWLKRESSSRDYSRIINIFRQIVDAVEYVHLQGLIHRDLKPSNIFFAYDDKVKIGDFGLVTAIPEECNGHKPCALNGDDVYIHNYDSNVSKNCNHTACVGTKLYMSPEQMNEQVYDYKVDIYSLGIILFELLMPFNTEMERIMALMDLRKTIYPKDFAANHPNEYKLLRMMLDDDPNKRPTTLGVKARAPILHCGMINQSRIDDGKWHFELPRLNRNSSVSGLSHSISNNEIWMNSNIL